MTLPKSSHPFATVPAPSPCRVCGADRTTYESEAETPLQAQISFYEGTCPACTKDYWIGVIDTRQTMLDAVDYFAAQTRVTP